MSYVNDVLDLVLESFDDDAVQRIAASRGHTADHWVHPGHDKRAWPILSQKVISPAAHTDPKTGRRILKSIPGSDKPAVSRFTLSEPEKAPVYPGYIARGNQFGLTALHSIEIGKGKKVDVHEYKGHHFYHWRDENPRQRLGRSYPLNYDPKIPREEPDPLAPGGTEHSERLYGSKEGFAAADIGNPERVHNPGGRAATPTEIPAGFKVRKIPMGVRGVVKPK